jgi:hypothetical protein
MYQFDVNYLSMSRFPGGEVSSFVKHVSSTSTSANGHIRISLHDD